MSTQLTKQTEIQFPGVRVERGRTTLLVAKVGAVLAVTLSYPREETQDAGTSEIDDDAVATVVRQQGAPALFSTRNLRWSHVEHRDEVVTLGMIVDTRVVR